MPDEGDLFYSQAAQLQHYHDHKPQCSHIHMQYCIHCNVAYCNNCGKEFREGATFPYKPPQPWPNSPWPNSAASDDTLYRVTMSSGTHNHS